MQAIPSGQALVRLLPRSALILLSAVASSRGALLCASPTPYEIRSGGAWWSAGVRRRACSGRAGASACRVVQVGCCQRCCRNFAHCVGQLTGVSTGQQGQGQWIREGRMGVSVRPGPGVSERGTAGRREPQGGESPHGSGRFSITALPRPDTYPLCFAHDSGEADQSAASDPAPGGG